jgi:iron complex outermembrane receptor protein
MRSPDKWSARVEGGVSEAHRNRMISTLGSVNLTTGAGRDAITYTPGQFWKTVMAAPGGGEFMTGSLRHEILLGVARTKCTVGISCKCAMRRWPRTSIFRW